MSNVPFLDIFTLFLSTAIPFLAIVFSPIPMRLGFYRWIAKKQPRWTGFVPAFHYGVKPGYTFEDLYTIDLTGQTAIITGGNSGIGYEAALALSRLGATVIIAGRNIDKCQIASIKIRSDTSSRGPVNPMVVDVSSMESVQTFVKEFRQQHQSLDMLFLNAGISSSGCNQDDASTPPLSVDGIEKVFATNLLGHHLMYRLLEPMIRAQSTKPVRIVLTSSGSSFRNNPLDLYQICSDIETLNKYQPEKDGHARYRQSKLGQIVWSKELTRQLEEDGVRNVFVNSYHPGVVDTPIFDKDPNISASAKKLINFMRKRVLWKATDASLTMLYLGVKTDALIQKRIRGKYFHPIAQEIEHPLANNEKQQKKLWAFLDELVKEHVVDSQRNEGPTSL